MYEIKKILETQRWVRSIEYLEEERRKSLLLRSCKVILIDFSTLHCKEIWKDDSLLKYSYYWITANNKTILGWDNAPHHKGIETFPHHKHRGNEIELSNERDFQDVVKYIDEILNHKFSGKPE
jgi:hypothetical protein